MRTESHIATSLRFIGEQDGMAERGFKERILPVLAEHATVERGYLARVAYVSASEESVALCILARHPQDSLLLQIGALFASMFGRDQHLDLLFINRDQDQELVRVCAPFFVSIE